VGLEIGALNRPIINLDDPGKIFYLDHLSKTDLKEKYRKDPTVNHDEIVDVDFIVDDGDIVKAVNGNKFDYVIASHVIEHVPNPIRWLRDIFEILNPGGMLYLLIPDKRFTFDFQRPLTTFGTVLEAYFANRKIPSVAAVYDHFSTAVALDGAGVWSGLLKECELLPLAGNDQAYEQANKVYSEDYYIDVHHSIFTPASFFGIIERLVLSDILHLEIESFDDTNIGNIEFFVSIKKPSGSDLQSKSRCLEKIPKLPLDSFVSPYMPQVKSLGSALEAAVSTQNYLQREIEENRRRYSDLEIERVALQGQINLMQKVLDRRSVRFIMAAIHFLATKLSVLLGRA
jgi:SAM-dependent methyltransferase